MQDQSSSRTPGAVYQVIGLTEGPNSDMSALLALGFKPTTFRTLGLSPTPAEPLATPDSDFFLACFVVEITLECYHFCQYLILFQFLRNQKCNDPHKC